MVRADFSAFITATTASHARVPEGWESPQRASAGIVTPVRARTIYEPGELAQWDLWEPPVDIPVRYGQRARLPVIVGVPGFSRWILARMIASKQTRDVLGGHRWCLRTAATSSWCFTPRPSRRMTGGRAASTIAPIPKVPFNAGYSRLNTTWRPRRDEIAGSPSYTPRRGTRPAVREDPADRVGVADVDGLVTVLAKRVFSASTFQPVEASGPKNRARRSLSMPTTTSVRGA